ncbi:cilia- and flagella-associated protein 157 [Thrips palmi]|uniref:Cilia- and flagella-associated protein 157 n=1 Tax=Thrips palmi TaxID=161013 RepID=A0A6P8YGJ4_THRPL|nr:cilia- and flagella-associated protein 157 [Thrips palmi]XP_034238864.1 cilia- and flagella-associated protein 157 [Thrips palmi]
MGRKGKGGKGKKGKKGKKTEEEDKNLLTEVDKEFYELQITDLNRKLARLRSQCAELELSNTDISSQRNKLEEDRADVISFLNRTLSEKEDDILELKERLEGLQQTRDMETKAFREKVEQMEQEFKAMQLQLTSEVKLLAGKLNALDEFRVQRDDLMAKFVTQEKQMEEQTQNHARELYEVERKFIVGKDSLKKEMETRLLQLSTEFQEATESRIASTTHRVIRENIAINNELDLMLVSTKELTEENSRMREKDREMKLTVELHEKEKKMALNRSEMQSKLIDRLSVEHAKLSTRVKELTHYQSLSEQYKKQLSEAEERHNNMCTEMRKLKSQLFSSASEREHMLLKVANMRQYANRVNSTLLAAVNAIKQALEIQDHPSGDEPLDLALRDNLLATLLEMLTKYDLCNLQPNPKETGSLSTIQLSLLATSTSASGSAYRSGDLGLVPRKEETHTPSTEPDAPVAQ